FRFPRSGGTGEIYRRLACRLDGKVDYGREVVAVDAAQRVLRFADGRSEGYDALVSTMPLDVLVAAVDDCAGDVCEGAAALEHNGAWIVGVGYELPLRDDRSWLYFADPAVPFYRATNFAKYAAANVPGADTSRFSSYMTESSYSQRLPRERDGHEHRVLEALVATGLAPAEPGIPRHDGRGVRIPEPDARPRPGARRRAAVADGARHLLAGPVRVVALRDRQHGPRRQDGDRRGAAHPGGPPRGDMGGLSRRTRE